MATDELLNEIRDLIAEREELGIRGLTDRLGPSDWADIVQRLDEDEVAVLLESIPDDEIPGDPGGAGPGKRRGDPPAALSRGSRRSPRGDRSGRCHRHRRRTALRRSRADPGGDGAGRSRRDSAALRLSARYRRGPDDTGVRGHLPGRACRRRYRAPAPGREEAETIYYV